MIVFVGRIVLTLLNVIDIEAGVVDDDGLINCVVFDGG